MIRYLKIQNRGLLDTRLISLMGGTTKDNDHYKIGQFGTGLKYALAYLIRNNIMFKIFIDGKQIEIDSRPETIQGETFNVIYIDGERTSVTDKMGMDWKGWMIVREIWCNALDEENSLKQVTSEAQKGMPGHTVFYIQLAGEIKEAVDNWHKYFLHNVSCAQDHKEFALYPSNGPLKLYKNGVLIHEDTRTGKNSVFAYDLKHNASINELREFTGSEEYQIAQTILKMNEAASEYLLENIEGSYEEDVEWSYADTWRSQDGDLKGVLSAIGSAKIIDYESFNNLKARGLITEGNRQGFVKVPKAMYKLLSLKSPNIGALRTDRDLTSFYLTNNEKAMTIVNSALAILENTEYHIPEKYSITVGVFGDKSVVAQVDTSTGEIMVSEDVKDKSIFDMVATLIEEFEHIKTGLNDCSRAFQQHWINMFTKRILEEASIQL